MQRSFAPFLIAVFLTACTLPLTGLPREDTPEVAIEPNFICSGDRVSVRWDTGPQTRNRAFCSAPDGGYRDRMICSSDRGCPVDGRCIDGLCVAPSIDPNEVDFGSGCERDRQGVISFVPGRIRPITFSGARGARAFTMNASAEITVSFAGIPTLSPPSPVTRFVQVVPGEDRPPVRHTVDFGAPLCSAPSTPLTIDLTEEGPNKTVTSEDVEIVEVFNASPYEVVVRTSDPTRGPVRLRPGERTGVLNGASGVSWTVTPVIAGTPEDCTTDPGTPTGDPGTPTPVLPAAALQLNLSCLR